MGEFNFMDALKGGARELLGTMSIGFAIVGLMWNISNSEGHNPLGMATSDDRLTGLLVIGASYWLTLSILGGGKVGGQAYFNPATALGAAFEGSLHWFTWGIYLVFQFVGFWIGFLLATWTYPGDVCIPLTDTASGVTLPCAERAIRHFNPYAGMLPARYKGTTYDNDKMGNTHTAIDSVTGLSYPTSDEWGIGSALFFEAFFAFGVTLAVFKKNNIVTAGAYALAFYLAMDVSGGLINPAIGLGGGFAGWMRGFSQNGQFVDQDQFTKNAAGETTEFQKELTAQVLAEGTGSIHYDQSKALPTGFTNLWINVLAPFVGAIVAACFNWFVNGGNIFFSKGDGDEEPAV